MDIEKLLTPLEDDENAKEFSKNFVQVFASPAFGAISKTEVDNLVFGLLVKAGALDPKSQVYEIARDLNVTPAKARNLLFQWQLRSMGNGDNLKDDLVAALKSVKFVKDGDFLSFGVESPLLREELRSRLKRMGIYADTSFSSDMIRISVNHFVEFLDDFLGDAEKEEIRRALIKGSQNKDDSFKDVVLPALKDLAKKAVSVVEPELIDIAVRGLIKGMADGVTKALAMI